MCPPRLDKKRPDSMGCKLCEKTFEGKPPSGVRSRLARHIGVVHGKVYDLIKDLDFSQIHDAEPAETLDHQPKLTPTTSVSSADFKGSKKPLKEITCKECEEVFATKEMMSLHTCESLLDEHFVAEETQERSVKPRKFSQDTSTTPTKSSSNRVSTESIEINQPRVAMKRLKENDDFSNEEEEPLKKVQKTSSSTATTTSVPSKWNYPCMYCDAKIKTVDELTLHFYQDHYDEVPLE